MTHDDIWNNDSPVRDILDIDVPSWIDQDISCADIIAICEGGCASGAYMPAVTYHAVSDTMSRDGDDVLQYIDDQMGELPQPPRDSGWSALACFYLSYAVELWASAAMSELEGLEA